MFIRALCYTSHVILVVRCYSAPMEIVTTSRSHGQLKTPCGVDWSIMVAAVYYETKNICLMKFTFVMFLLLNKRVPTSIYL